MAASTKSSLQLSCSAANTIAALNAMDVHLQELGLYEGEKVSDTLASRDNLKLNEDTNAANCAEVIATNDIDVLERNATEPTCNVNSVIKQTDSSAMHIHRDETKDNQLANACNSPEKTIESDMNTLAQKSVKVKRYSSTSHAIHAKDKNILQQRQSLLHTSNTMSQASSEKHICDVIAEANNYLSEEMSRSTAAFAANVQSKKTVLECKERITYLSHIAALKRENDLYSAAATSATAFMTTPGPTHKAEAAATVTATNNTAVCTHSLSKSNRTCSLILSDTEERQTSENNTRMQPPSALTLTLSSPPSSEESAKVSNQISAKVQNAGVDRSVIEFCRWLVAGIVGVAIEVSDNRFLPVADMYNKPVRRVNQDLSVSYWNKLIKEHFSLLLATTTSSSTLLAEAKPESLPQPSPLSQTERKQEKSIEQNTSQIAIAQTHNSENNKCMPELPTREANIKETRQVQELHLSHSKETINKNTPLQEPKEKELSENISPIVNKVVKETANLVQAKAILPDAHTVNKESADEETLYTHEVHDALEFMANEALASDNTLQNKAIDQVRVYLQNNLACCQANAIEEWRTHIESNSSNNNNTNNKIRKCIMDEEHINGTLTVLAGWFVFGDRLSGAHLLRHLIETESENEINNQLNLLLAKNKATQKLDHDDDDKANEMLNSSEYEVKRRYLTPKLLLQSNSEILRALFTSLMSMAANTNSSSSSAAMTSVANTSNINTNTNTTTAAASSSAANTSNSTSLFVGVHGSLSFASANNPGKVNHNLNTKLMRGPASFHGKGSSVGVGGSNNFYNSTSNTGIGSYGLGSTVNSSSFYYRSLATVMEILMNYEDVYYDTQRCVGDNETETTTSQHYNNNEMNTRNDEASHASTSISHLYQRTSNHDEHGCDSNKKGNNNNSTSHYDNEGALHVYSVVADLLAKELICTYIRNIHTLSPLSVPECIMHEIDKPTHDRVNAKDGSGGGGAGPITTITTMSLPSSVSSSSSYSRASQTLPAVPSSRKSSKKQGNELLTSTHDVNNNTSNNMEATHDMRNESITPTKIIDGRDNITNLEEHHNECNKKTRLESLIMVDFPRSVNFHAALQHALIKRMNEVEVKIAAALQSAIEAEEEQAEFEANANITAANDRRGKRNKLSSANDRTLQRPSSGMKTTLNEHATLISSSPSQINQSRHNTMETQTSNSANPNISMLNGSHNNKGSTVGISSGINNVIITTNTTTNAVESTHDNNNEGSHTNEHDIRAAQLRQINIAAYPPLLVGGLFLSYDIVDRFNRLQELYMCASNSNGDNNVERNKLNELCKVNSSKELQHVLEETYHNILCPESFQIKKEVSNVHSNPVMPNRTLSMTRRSVVYQSGSALQSNINNSSSNNMLEMSTRKSTMSSALHDNTTGSTLPSHNINTTSSNTTPLSTLSNSSTCNTHKEFLADTWDINTFRAVLTQQHHAVDMWQCAWEKCVNTDMMHHFIKYHTCTDVHDGYLAHEAVPSLKKQPKEEELPTSSLSASAVAAAMAGNILHKPTHPIKSTARDGKAQSNDKHTRDNKNRLEKNALIKITGTQSSLPSKKTTCSTEEKSNMLHMNEMSGTINNEKMINFSRVVFMSHVIDCSNILQVCSDKNKCSHVSKDDEYEQQLRVIAFIERKLEQTTMFANVHTKNEKCCISNTVKQAKSMESVGNKVKENANATKLLLSPPSLTINDYRLTPEALKEMLSLHNKYTSQIHKIDVICNRKSRACFDTPEDDVNLTNTSTPSLNEVKSLHIACLESEMKYERVFFVYLLQVLTLLQRKAFPLSLWDKSAEVFNATLFYTSIDGNFESILEELEYLTIQTRHALLCYGIQWMYNALEVTRRALLKAVSTSKMLLNCVLSEELRQKNCESAGESNSYDINNNKNEEENNYKQSLTFVSSLNITSLATELVKEMQSCTSSHSCETIMENIKCKLENEIKENLSAISACSDVGNSAVITETIAKMIVQHVWSGAPLLLRTINVLCLFMSAFRQAEQSANNWLKHMYNEVLTITPVNIVRNNNNYRSAHCNLEEQEEQEQTELEVIRTYIAKLRPSSMNDIFTKGIEISHCSKEQGKSTTPYVSERTIDLDSLLVKFTLSNFCLYNSPHLSCGAFVRCVLLSELPLLALLSSSSSNMASLSVVTAPITITPLSSEYVSHLHTIENECVDMEWNNLTVLPHLQEMICSCAHNFTLFATKHTLLPKGKLPIYTVQELLNSVFRNVYKSQTLSDECSCTQSEQFFTRERSADCTVNARLLLWNLVLSRLCGTSSDVNSKRNLLCPNNCYREPKFYNNKNNNNSNNNTSSAKVKLTKEQRRHVCDKYNYKSEEFMRINSLATHNLRQALSHIELTHDVVPSENGVINTKLLDCIDVIPEALTYILQCKFTHNASLELPLVDRISIDVLLQVATFTAPTWLGRVERLFHAITALKHHERHTSCSDVDKLLLTADEVVFYFKAISAMLGFNTKEARHSSITLTDDVRLLFSIDHVKEGLSLPKFMSSHWAQILINSQFRCKM